MKKTIMIIICIIVFPFSALANDWTREDTYRELVWTTLLIVDYGQTMNIARNPDRFKEYNPILGEHPSQSSVGLYMLSAAIIHPVISYLLPPKSDKWKWINRENFQYLSIGVEIGTVGNNLRIGISF